MTESTQQPRGLSPEQARQLVSQAGSIDAGAKLGGFPVGKFRKFCKANGISALKTGGPLISVFEESSLPREVLLDQENRELRAALKKASEYAVREERILEYLVESVPSLKPKYRPRRMTRSKKSTPHEFLLLWSDLHAGEVVFPEQVHGVNSYDWDVMLKRHDLLTQSILSFRDHRPYPVSALRIAALGDMIGGDIHEELVASNEMPAVDATLQLAVDMARWIENLVPEFPRITIDAVVGNHGRLSKKPTAKNVHANWDYVFYRFLEQQLQRYPSVTVTAPRSAFHHMEIMGNTILLWHGDGVRSSTPGVPWGGVIRRARELEKQFSHLGRIDHHLLGHWHNPQAADDFRILINGSVKGPDEYSLKAFGGGTPATQLLVPFHPSFGLTEVARLDLQRGR